MKGKVKNFECGATQNICKDVGKSDGKVATVQSEDLNRTIQCYCGAPDTEGFLVRARFTTENLGNDAEREVSNTVGDNSYTCPRLEGEEHTCIERGDNFQIRKCIVSCHSQTQTSTEKRSVLCKASNTEEETPHCLTTEEDTTPTITTTSTLPSSPSDPDSDTSTNTTCCPCPEVRNFTHDYPGLTGEQLAEKLEEEIKKELTLDTSKLSKTLAKKTSKYDNRRSSQALGSVGVVVIVVVFSLVVLFDLHKLTHFWGRRCRKHC
ncbi:uncharacterized protein [Littorina saxatilis]